MKRATFEESSEKIKIFSDCQFPNVPSHHCSKLLANMSNLGTMLLSEKARSYNSKLHEDLDVKDKQKYAQGPVFVPSLHGIANMSTS